MPQPERYYFTDFHTIGLKKNRYRVYQILLEFKIFRGAYIQRKICTSKSARFIQLYRRKICLEAYSWKEIYVSNLQQVSTETCLEDADLSKTQPCKYFVHVDQEYGKCKNLCVTVQFLLCFILNLRTISKYKPRGACIWRAIYQTFFCIMSLGGLYLEGFIH